MKIAKRNIRDLANAKRVKRREHLVQTVKRGLEETGDALQELRDDGHWEDTGHTTFADFCKEYFGITKTKLYTILRCLEVTKTLPKKFQTEITDEAPLLALSRIPEDSRAEVLEKAISNGGATADNIRFHSAKPVPKTNVTTPVTKSEVTNSPTPQPQSLTKEKPKSESKEKSATVVCDAGTPIPLDAMPYAMRQDEVTAITSAISKMRTKIKSARDGSDYLWVKHGQEAYEHLSRAYSYISDASPDCVCLVCQGSPSLQKEGCSACGSTGMISQYRFDHFLPKEMREIKLKSNAEFAKTHETTKTRPKPEPCS